MAITGKTPSEKSPGVKKAGAFDIRTLIAALIGSYGLVLTVMGLLVPSDAQIEKAAGLNINLWAGLGMLLGAAVFQGWAMWRPVIVQPDPDDTGSDGMDTANDGPLGDSSDRDPGGGTPGAHAAGH